MRLYRQHRRYRRGWRRPAAVVINGDSGIRPRRAICFGHRRRDVSIVANGTGDEVKIPATPPSAIVGPWGLRLYKNTFEAIKDINVSLGPANKALVNGNTSQITLTLILTNSAQDSSGIFRGATGVNVSGDSNAADITGDLLI